MSKGGKGEKRGEAKGRGLRLVCKQHWTEDEEEGKERQRVEKKDKVTLFVA